MTRLPKIQFRVYPKIQYRVYLPGKPPFIDETLGLSELAAYHPQAVRVEVVGSEPVCVKCPTLGSFF